MLTLFFVAVFNAVYANDEPLIGILTLPCENDPGYCNFTTPSHPEATTYLPASYVKWLESGGARIIPIQSDDSIENINKLLPKLNGVLSTGGAASFTMDSSWYKNLANILSQLRLFNKNNQNKQAIPLWATCLSFQAVQCLTAGTTDIVVSRYAEDDALPIIFQGDVYDTSKIFNNSFFDKDYTNMIYDKLSKENLTMNFHKYGVAETSYDGKYKYLSNNFTILGESIDQYGDSFVTLIQSINNEENGNLYWFGSQFHPEKVQYIFDKNDGDNNIVHNVDGIIVNQYFSTFFVNECRERNNNEMDTDEYNTKVIYNYEPYFIYNGTHSYEQVYLFGKPM